MGQRAHEKYTMDITVLQTDLAKAQQHLADTQDNLGKTTALANSLHGGLHKTNDSLTKKNSALGRPGLETPFSPGQFRKDVFSP